jgi:hypothetical protein
MDEEYDMVGCVIFFGGRVVLCFVCFVYVGCVELTSKGVCFFLIFVHIYNNDVVGY